jgi:hypothetical protein
MGMFSGRWSHAVSNNPNPNNFKVKTTVKVGKHWVFIIHYPNATNFEGDKILLTTWDPREKQTIDPHFAQGSGILARFEPTELGWELALKTAKLL